VLITGESGTGKELVAAAIHNESGRGAGSLVPLNCGALPENILESELFGHVRGAFTGAIRDKKGRFELADGGTLFLDEIGELSLPVQVKLLRVLEEKKFERVGGEKPISVDVRIISATNRDLREMVSEGRFREDLFYRLCVVPIKLPPLRDRREDFPYLVEHVLDRIRRESGKTVVSVSNAALDCLLAHRWPGNIRELINALQFASVRCTGEVIWPQHLPPEVRRTENERKPPAVSHTETSGVSGRPSKRGRAKLTPESVKNALSETGGNKVKAAQLLGVGRATLYRYLDEVKRG
jgi:transcriptional regulator with PAS, ATPase and Fis domain